VKAQVVENKYVSNSELWVPLQFPSGDDVSAYTRCEAALTLCIQHNDPEAQMAKILGRDQPCKLKVDVLLCKDD